MNVLLQRTSLRALALLMIAGLVLSFALFACRERKSSFGEDESGNLYVADHGGGNIYKIVVP